MRRILSNASIFALCASAATAGGIDRSGQSVAAIFEDGSYAELSFGSVSPSVSGTAGAALGGFGSGDMAPSYTQLGGAIKHSYNDEWSVALIYDQPFGADVDYSVGTGYFAQGSTARIESHALTGVVKYTMPTNVSLYGGLRHQTFRAASIVPFVGGYTGLSDTDGGFGYLLGAAYERPDIALRIALTYNSKIKHNLQTLEFGAAESTTSIETPESLNLEFQSGIAEDTLLFGSIRWVDWSNFDITPIQYQGATGGSLVSYEDDSITYSIGIGRRLNENWSVAATLGYEKSNGGFAANLGPTDGYTSIGLGATYTEDNMKITGGIRYVDVGNADTTVDGVNTAANFTSNKAIGVGIKVGYSF